MIYRITEGKTLPIRTQGNYVVTSDGSRMAAFALLSDAHLFVDATRRTSEVIIAIEEVLA